MNKSTRHVAQVVIIFMALAVLIMGGLLATWFAVPTKLYLDTKSLSYERTDAGWQATFVRETPRGSVFAEWGTEIRLVGRDTQCSANGRTEYEQRPSNTVEYMVGPQITRCLEMSGLKLVVHRHWVSIGPIRLRPAELNYLIGKDGKVERLN